MLGFLLVCGGFLVFVLFFVLCLLCVYVFHCSCVCVCVIVLATFVSFTLRVSTVYDVLFPV